MFSVTPKQAATTATSTPVYLPFTSNNSAALPFSTNPMATQSAPTFVATPAVQAKTIFGATSSETRNPFGSTTIQAWPSPPPTSSIFSNNNNNNNAITITANPWGSTGFAVPAVASGGSASTMTANPFNVTPTAAQSPFGSFIRTNPSDSRSSAFQPATTANIFHQSPTMPLASSTASNNTVNAFNVAHAHSSATFPIQPDPFAIKPQATNNIFKPLGTATTGSSVFQSPWPAATLAGTASAISNPFAIAPAVTPAPTMPSPFAIKHPATNNIFNTCGPATTGSSVFQSPWSSGSSTTTTTNPAIIPAATQAGHGSTMSNPLVIKPPATNNIFKPLGTATTGSSVFQPPWPAATLTGTASKTPNSFTFKPPATNSIFNPPATAATGSSMSQPSLPVTSSVATIPIGVPALTVASVSLPQTQEQSSTTIQQSFLAACLLDPYGSHGKKEFTSLNQIQPSKEPPAVSTSSPSISTVTASTSIPTITPIQTNSRKALSSHSLGDIHFNLKPVSSSAITNDDTKSSDQQSKTTSTQSIQRSFTSTFTCEEEMILLNQKKTSKLRLPNDILNSSVQSGLGRSLYPLRRLDELETLTKIIKATNISIPDRPVSATVPSTFVNNERAIPRSNDNHQMKISSRLSPSVTNESSSYISNPRQCINDNVRSGRLPNLTRNDYYTKPTMSELKSLFNDQGECLVRQFTVGREQYGSVTFYGQINLAGLNLDDIIEIQRHEVTVYPDDDHKPALGEELNLPARITLLAVYPIDRTTQEEIVDIERIKAMNYQDHLRQITAKFQGEFISYGMEDGSWTFTVQHFTRYGLDDHIPEQPIEDSSVHKHEVSVTRTLSHQPSYVAIKRDDVFVHQHDI